MATIYRKTAKGLQEIETRMHRLVPRLRQTLILVDGQRSDEDFRKLLPDADTLLASLAEGEFIEVVAIMAPKLAARPVPAPAAPAPALPRSFEQTRALAVRAFTEQVGPVAEALAMKMERTRNSAELLPLLGMAQQIIRNTRGAQAAADYGARFTN